VSRQTRPTGKTVRLSKVHMVVSLKQSILLLAVLAASLADLPPVTAETMRLTSEGRAKLLAKACELADDIAVVTVSSKECIEDRESILTRYVTHINQQLKGAIPPDSTLVLYAAGGTVGNRGMAVEDEPEYKIGMSYLIFTIECPDLIGPFPYDHSLISELYDSTAVNKNPPGIVSRAALLDSIQVAIDSCSVNYQKTHADLVVRGLIEWDEKEYPTPRPWYSDGTVSLHVKEILSHRAGPLPPVGESLVFSTRAGSWSLLAPGRSPIVARGEEIIVFLRREAGGWMLGTSAYAKYRVKNSMAYVEMERTGCLMHPAVLDSLPLQTLYHVLED
jgi:hypothetical protein